MLLFNWLRLERWGLANGRREAATTRLPLVQSALSPDGRWLALWDYWDTTLGLVDLQEGRVQFTRDLDSAVYGVGFSPGSWGNPGGREDRSMASRGRSAAVGTVVDAGDGEFCGSGCREEMDCGRRDGERRLALGSGPPRIFERYRLSDASSEGLRLIRLPEGQEEMAFLVPRWSDLLWGEDPRRPLIMHLKGLDGLTGTGATRRVWTSDSEWGWSIVPLAGCRLVAVAGTKGRLRIRERRWLEFFS